jgi:hypothetical protein
MDTKRDNEKTVRITLTEAQQEQIRKETGNEVSTVEFAFEQLEERIAPALKAGYNVTNF